MTINEMNASNADSKWYSINSFTGDCTITDDVKYITLSTRNFELTWHTKDADYGEFNNDAFDEITLRNTSVLIDKSEIIGWIGNLLELCGEEYVFLRADVDGCRDWLKYINFVRFNNDKFIVCNRWFKPIKYKDINEKTIKIHS